MIVPVLDSEDKPSKKEKKFIIPEEDNKEFKTRYTKCKVVEFSKDCVVSKGLDLSMAQDRFVIVESHLIEKMDIDGEQIYLVPEHAVKLVSSS